MYHCQIASLVTSESSAARTHRLDAAWRIRQHERYHTAKECARCILQQELYRIAASQLVVRYPGTPSSRHKQLLQSKCSDVGKEQDIIRKPRLLQLPRTVSRAIGHVIEDS